MCLFLDDILNAVTLPVFLCLCGEGLCGVRDHYNLAQSQLHAGIPVLDALKISKTRTSSRGLCILNPFFSFFYRRRRFIIKDWGAFVSRSE